MPWRRIAIVAAASLAAATGLVARAGQGSKLPRASEVVEPRAYVSLEPVPRGRAFELAVVARIRAGFHINSHQPAEDYLIPTTLEASLPSGFRLIETIYPPGVLHKFAFAEEKLSVYEGSVTLKMKLEATAGAPLGQQDLALALRYQACNDVACLPPATLPLTVPLEVAPADAPARAVHPEVFATRHATGQKPR